MSKPTCAYCGKLYGARAIKRREFVVEIGQPIPPNLENTPMIREEFYPELPPKGPATPEEATGYVPMDGMASAMTVLNYTGRKGRRVTRHYWDGETYKSGYDPFCTLRCGLLFVQSSYRAGYRLKG